jgi:hypothetical protein
MFATKMSIPAQNDVSNPQFYVPNPQKLMVLVLPCIFMQGNGGRFRDKDRNGGRGWTLFTPPEISFLLQAASANSATASKTKYYFIALFIWSP